MGTYTNHFSLSRSDPSSAVSVKYIEIDLNIKRAQFMSYSPGTTCLFGTGKGDLSVDEVKIIFGINTYGAWRIQLSKYLKKNLIN